MTDSKLIVGLGNPGKKYEKNRHNVGFMAVNRIVRELMVSPHVERKLESVTFYHHATKTVFAKPQTFMNSSGEAVSRLMRWFKTKPDDLYVIHDDLDIRLGEYKIQKGKGPRLHNGIKSIEEKLGTSEFWRIRVGVDNRDPQSRTPGEQYVLQDFRDDETLIAREVIDKIVDELKIVISN